MKTFTLLVIAFACVATPAMATRQRPDLITFDGVLYELPHLPSKNFPLESLWPDRKDRPIYPSDQTARTLQPVGVAMSPSGKSRKIFCIWQLSMRGRATRESISKHSSQNDSRTERSKQTGSLVASASTLTKTRELLWSSQKAN